MASGKAPVTPVRYPDRFYIGGEWVAPSSEDLIDVVQPATEDVWARVAGARKADVYRAVAADDRPGAGRLPAGDGRRPACAGRGPELHLGLGDGHPAHRRGRPRRP